jgi:hypothetical protein
MANSYNTNPIILDTFSTAIDLCSKMGFPAGTPIKVDSIEWYNPTNVSDTAIITDGNGVPIFSETCFVAKQPVIKSYGGAWLRNIVIGVSGVASGAINIVLSMGQS